MAVLGIKGRAFSETGDSIEDPASRDRMDARASIADALWGWNELIPSSEEEKWCASPESRDCCFFGEVVSINNAEFLPVDFKHCATVARIRHEWRTKV